MNIRIASEDDAYSYAAYLNQLFSENLETLIPRASEPTIAQVQAFIKSHTGSPSALLIAQRDGNLIGTLNLTRMARPEIDHIVTLGMNVAAPLRGQGIGCALLEKAIAWCRYTSFAERIELEVLENNARAIHLFETHGFKREGRRELAVKRGSSYLASYIYAYISSGPA